MGINSVVSALTDRVIQNRIRLSVTKGLGHKDADMGFGDIVLLSIRWLHAIAAVAWVGGGIFYLLVLRPALNSSEGATAGLMSSLGGQFRHLVNTAIGVLIVTGIVLTVSRLTTDYAGIPYVAVLSIKIGLALYMFYLVRFLRPRTYSEASTDAGKGLRRLTAAFTGATAVLVLGVIVFLLADILRALVENDLGG